MTGSFVVEMQGITKSFGSLSANTNITLRVRDRSVHAIVGENGAGKSTLMNILYGMLQPDEGRIFLRGEECVLRSPADAIRRGVAMVHQHFMLVPPLTVMENIILGFEPTRFAGAIDERRAINKIEGLSAAFHLPVDVRATVASLPVGIQQRVEILKVLYRGGEIVIFDEPTGVLTPQEIDAFFVTLRSLQKEGKTILLITHKLGEVLDVSDEITVLRRGAVVLNVPTPEADENRLTEAIIGRSLTRSTQARPPAGVTPLVSMDGVSLTDAGRGLLKGISLTVHRGEIVGIAGVEGSGQLHLVDLLSGKRRPSGGAMIFHSREKKPGKSSPVANIPQDRQKEGLVLDFTVAENLILGRASEFSGAVVLDNDAIAAFASEAIRELQISPPSPLTPARFMSGGNQQKVVIGRELSKQSHFIIAHQPTRGLDIGAREFVHEMLLKQRTAGNGLIVLSSDLAELLELCDRIAVMFNGTIVATRKASEWNERSLGASMTGMYQQSA